MTKTNLITGFLGSGKTTSILHMLANKESNEKWAVLVNEFGEVGIDGALLAGGMQDKDDKSIIGKNCYVQETTTGADAISSIAAPFFANAVEVDGKLKMVRRGAAVQRVLTIS